LEASRWYCREAPRKDSRCCRSSNTPRDELNTLKLAEVSTICNDFGNHTPYSDYLSAYSQTRIPVRWPKAAPNLEPREDIWPTDKAPVIQRFEDGTNQFAELRWGFPPARLKGAPIINFRSEGRRFPVGRCLIPASHFSEFAGTKSPKQKWKFTKAGEHWF
jgi:putative SOS response-associated peptidase YedK